MILVPEQVKLLRERLQCVKKQLKGFDDYYDNIDYDETEVLHIPVGIDSFAHNQYHMEKKEKKEIKEILLNSTYLRKRTISHIEIGTRFLFQFFDEDEVFDFILVDKTVGMGSMQGFISKESPIGKQLLGARERDVIGKVGTVLEIKKEDKDYDCFFRDSNSCTLVCYEEDQKLKKLKRNRKFDLEAEEEWNTYQTITMSQKILLEQERERILAHSFSEEGKIRLKEIEQLLTQREVSSLPDDNTIGVGSCFQIMLFTPNGFETRRLEMVNEVVSDELKSDYIVRTSPLGSTVFGLKNKEKFLFRESKRDNHYVRGMVFDIDCQKEITLRENGYTYQKK